LKEVIKSLKAINETLSKTNELLTDLAQMVLIQIKTLHQLMPEEKEETTGEDETVFDPRSLYK